MRVNYWKSDGWPEPGSYELADISVTGAKKHLKEKGGVAFTAFLDRKWNLVGTRNIELKGNNTTKVHFPNEK
jgi:hypothetical protein